MSTTRAQSPVALPSGPHEFGKHPQPRPVIITRGKVTEIDLPTPPMGGKAWLLSEKGIFVLQSGPGTLRTIACTHAGSGNLQAIDGIPDDNGFFPDGEQVLPVRSHDESDAEYLGRLKVFHSRNGRAFYGANPIVMGSWMLDAGFMHGLTLKVDGGHDSTSAIATVVWMPFRQRGA